MGVAYPIQIVLQLEHHVGGAGQRRVTVYCPYWLINHTNCMLIYRQVKPLTLLRCRTYCFVCSVLPMS